MGAWTFVHGRLHRLLRHDYSLRHVSRPASASPASGSQTVHAKQQADLLTGAFDGL
jgi:2-oxoglutarate dehydrogenase E1 component